MAKEELTRRIKEKAFELGYVRAGIARADEFPELLGELKSRAGYERWQGDGTPFEKMAKPTAVMPEAKSIISLIWAYGDIAYPDNLLQHVARTYLSRSYCPPRDTDHGRRLTEFEDFLEAEGIGVVHATSNMQTADRLTAARAGVITFGRNNFAFAGEYGSFITLVSFIVDAELEYDQSSVKQQCPPDCRLCIDACPTAAINAKGQLIANRCVLYNNIIPTSALDMDVRPGLGQRIHGCDECQAVCPRNKLVLERASKVDPVLEQISEEFDLEKILFLDDSYYERVVKPIMFNYIKNMDLFRRNAAIAMGNSGDAKYIPALEKAALEGSEMVREAAAWALGRIRPKGVE